MDAEPKSSRHDPAAAGPHCANDRWGGDGASGDGENPAAAAARSVSLFVKELTSYARYFLGAKVDGFVATGRKIAIYAALGVVGMMVAGGMLFTAAFLLLHGLALGLGKLLWQQQWLGELVVALLVLGGTALGIKFGINKFTKASRLKTEQKYESQRIQQRVEFGRDVHERATQASGNAK
jgi:hypothetical protein